MSLTDQQRADTQREFRENLEKSGLSIEDIAARLGTNVAYVKDVLALKPRRLEDPWILRNYLNEAVRAAGKTPTTFTALTGDWHAYWFLDGNYIDNGRIEN